MSRDQIEPTERHAADAAALMLAAGTDREAYDQMVKTIRWNEVRPMLLALAEVGGSLVAMTNRHPEHRPAVAELLEALVAAYRDDDVG